jgi:hypothetical protein
MRSRSKIALLGAWVWMAGLLLLPQAARAHDVRNLPVGGGQVYT